jgi:hypothetical protein
VKLQSFFRIAFLLCCLLAVAQTARAALFAFEPGDPGHAVFPFDTFQHHHSCFTAYFEANRLADDAPNVYDEALYLAPPDRPNRPAWQPAGDARRTLGVFYVDAYEYPPPFLFLPRVIVALTGDFLSARAAWFVFQLLAVAGTLGLLAWHVGGEERRRVALLAPLFYLSLPVQIGLQIGNFQVLAFALAMVGMLAIARKNEVLGASVLSFVIVAKVFPGVLLLFLLGQRAYRAVLWTLGWTGVWIGLSLLVFGSAPWESFFVYHLPRIESGAAFPQLQIPYAIGINHSVQAIPAKLALFGIGSGSVRLGAALAWIYTLVICAAALLCGRSAKAPLAWALVLALASYRSPFLPQEYAGIGPILVLGLLAARASSSARRWLGFAAGFVMLQLQVPWGISRDPIVGALVNAVSQGAAGVVFVLAIGSLTTALRGTAGTLVRSTRASYRRWGRGLRWG